MQITQSKKPDMAYLPQELEVWYIIPALRRGLALEMVKLGMKQVDIAILLGVTKSAISQYLGKTRAIEFHFNAEIKSEIKNAAGRVLLGSSANAEIQRLIFLLKDERSICNFHHKLEHIDQHCDICFQHTL